MLARLQRAKPSMAQLPTQSQFGDYSEWPGRDVLDSGGERLGGVREIYLDRETGRPEWVLVDVDGRRGALRPPGRRRRRVLRRSSVAHTREQIRSAPGIGAEPRIDQSEERRLYAHYGLGYSEIDRGDGAKDDASAPTGWGEGDETPSWQARRRGLGRHLHDERVRGARRALVVAARG